MTSVVYFPPDAELVNPDGSVPCFYDYYAMQMGLSVAEMQAEIGVRLRVVMQKLADDMLAIAVDEDRT